MAFNHDRQSKLHEGTVSRSRRQRSDLRGIFCELAQAAIEGIRIPGDKLETRLVFQLSSSIEKNGDAFSSTNRPT